MTKYIESEEAIDAIIETAYEYEEDDKALTALYHAVDRLNDLPAADVVEVRHGKWVDTEPNLPDWSHRKKGMAYYCSACGHSAGKNKHNTYRWCPWCGAKMDGGQNDV